MTLTFYGRVRGDVGPITGQWQSILSLRFDRIEIFCSIMQAQSWASKGFRPWKPMVLKSNESGRLEHPSDRETCPDRQRRKTKTNKCALKHGVMRTTFPTLAEVRSPTTGFSHLSAPELDITRCVNQLQTILSLFTASAKFYGCMQDGDQWPFAYANCYSRLNCNLIRLNHVSRLKSGHMVRVGGYYLTRLIKCVHASVECSMISVGD